VKEICSWQKVTFYKSDNHISRYPDTFRKPIQISLQDFEENRETYIQYWLGYNTWISFFDHIKNIYSTLPMPYTMSYGSSENSQYSEWTYMAKNVYLSTFVVYDCENVLYSYSVKSSCKNIFNSIMVWWSSENIYSSVGIIGSFSIFYSNHIEWSNNIWFSKNLIWCTECLFCENLENKSYCIKNISYEKNEYLKKKEDIIKDKQKFPLYQQNIETKNMHISYSENIWNWYCIHELKDWNNCLFVWWRNIPSQNIFDSIGVSNGDYIIWCTWSWSGMNIYCSINSWIWNKIFYCDMCINCSYCLGCIGLKNKSFCILNKQYTKEERFEKANEIFTQMEKDWQLWKFFPASMNPFYFNDTVAYLIDDSFTREEVIAEWYLRRDEEIKVDIPDGSQVVKNTELNQYQGFDSAWNRTIDPEILEKVIVDEKWNAYRIIKMEYDFLMRYWLPLPKLHRLDRIKLGFKFK